MLRLLALLALVIALPARADSDLRSGDIVFQTTDSRAARLIRKATASPYSHTGILEVTPAGVFVIEAVQPVRRLAWKRWKRRGDGRVLVLRHPAVTPASAARIVAKARGFIGLPYDEQFEWGDTRLYCSELVRKAYARGAGLEIGRMERIGELHLSFWERLLVAHTDRKLPMDRLLVTPASLAADPALVRVTSTY